MDRDWSFLENRHEHPLDTPHAADPKPRATMLLYAAELAHLRDDLEEAEYLDARAWAMLECAGLDNPPRRWGPAEAKVWGQPTLYYYNG